VKAAPAPVQPAVYTTGTVSWTTDDPQAPRPAVPAVNPIQPVQFNRQTGPLGDETPEADIISLTPPGPQQLFRRDSEAQLLERIRQKKLNQAKPERIEFPKEVTSEDLSKTAHVGRAFPPGTLSVEPNYTCYRRLNFEQLNMERQGWDLGFISPFVSAAVFFKDVALLPYHIGTEPCRRYECNTGYCLPGSPTPLLLYPPELSLTGFVLEGLTIAGIAIVFPG
jgi:hypothetical protein